MRPNSATDEPSDLESKPPFSCLLNTGINDAQDFGSVLYKMMQVGMTIIWRLKYLGILSIHGPAAEKLGPNLSIWPTPFLPDCVGLFLLLLLAKA